MESLIIELKEIGQNGYFDLRNELDKFVRDQFATLYEGAVRLGVAIEADYYAPKRVQVGHTRLHESHGLKYADGHKYSDQKAPTEDQLRQTVKDIQDLIDAAAVGIPKPFALTIFTV